VLIVAHKLDVIWPWHIKMRCGTCIAWSLPLTERLLAASKSSLGGGLTWEYSSASRVPNNSYYESRDDA
jgi:hypothetical protein